MLDENLAVLLSRKLAGEASEEELQELAALLKDAPAQQYFVELLMNYWYAQKALPAEADLKADEHFKHILELANDIEKADNQTETHPNHLSAVKKLYYWLSVAAAILVTASIYLFWPQHSQKATAAIVPAKDKEVTAAIGAKSKIILPDGTQVWLNSESKLVYNSLFKDSFREVKLEGEAFFDVVKDARHPFIVHTSAIDIRVLGTAFNVKSYPKEKTIEATLIRGLIEVVRKNEPEGTKVILQPHEKLVFNKSKSSMEMAGSSTEKNEPVPQDISICTVPKNLPDSVIKETSWVYNRLIFEGDTFKELAIKMERWFNVQIKFKTEKVTGYRFRGAFDKENIDQALKALQLTAAFTYSIKNDVVVIDKK